MVYVPVFYIYEEELQKKIYVNQWAKIYFHHFVVFHLTTNVLKPYKTSPNKRNKTVVNLTILLCADYNLNTLKKDQSHQCRKIEIK